MLSQSELAEYLIEKWDYVPQQAPGIADKLLNMDPDIREAFDAYLDTGEFVDVPVYSEFSPKSLNEMVKIKAPAVFMLLDWIRREPEEAITAIKDELI